MLSPSEAATSASNPDSILQTTSDISSSSANIEPVSIAASPDNEPVTSTTNTNSNSTLEIDPAQLIFRLGLSSSPCKSESCNVVSPVASTSTERSSHVPDLFGSYVRASASNAPRRFNFEASPTAVTSSSKTSQQARPSGAASHPSTSRYHVPVQNTPIIPNLGPDVTIRPVLTKNISNKYEASSSRKNTQQKPNLDSNEIFKLLAGYKHLTGEVATLKKQLAEKESLIHEILGNFSTEVAKINNRLATVEKELMKTRQRGNLDAQEEISEQLDDLSLTKKEDGRG